MTVNSSRSQRRSLLEGATDGKYRKVRPNTEVAQLTGDAPTAANRADLHAWYNYGYAAQEKPLPQRQVPGT
jgi:hypothetical protein